MFLSEPICILTAGQTVDGRHVDQKIIDEIAETYNTEVYTARINEDHYQWRYKFGSVVSVEARGNQLFAQLKPNSQLLRMAEQGQLLHTSCEFVEDFAGTGKAYLTGLALTDNPASLGTTQIKLSAQHGNAQKNAPQYVSTNTVDVAAFSPQPNQPAQLPENEVSLLRKFINLLKSAPDANDEQLSQQPASTQEPDMSQEVEALLKQSVEQNQALSNQLSTLIETLSKQQADHEPEDDTPEATEETTLNTLSAQVAELTEQLSKLSGETDEQARQLAGGTEEIYL